MSRKNDNEDTKSENKTTEVDISDAEIVKQYTVADIVDTEIGNVYDVVDSVDAKRERSTRYNVKKVMKYAYVLFAVAFILVAVSALTQNWSIEKMKEQIRNSQLSMNKKEIQFTDVQSEVVMLRSASKSLSAEKTALQKENEKLHKQLEDYKTESQLKTSTVSTLIDAQILYDLKKYEECATSLTAIDTKILDEKATIVYKSLTTNVLRVLNLDELPTPDQVTAVNTQQDAPTINTAPKN